MAMVNVQVVLSALLLLTSTWMLFVNAAPNDGWHRNGQGFYRRDLVVDGVERCLTDSYLVVPNSLKPANDLKSLEDAKRICSEMGMILPPKLAAHCLYDFAYLSNIHGLDYSYVWADFYQSTEPNTYRVKGRQGRDFTNMNGSVVCYVVYCNVPDIANGTLNASSIQYGKQVKYTCNVGFSPVLNTTCLATGFLLNKPACKPVYCNVPDIANGTLSASSIQYGKQVKYTCHVGFSPVLNTTCLATGFLLNEPACKRLRIQELLELFDS
ncbi:sushi, von Willebrand factor type A, EGF and pentraxin domain-containing protein 1-like [Sycon ciliatum]|uniref:sushi, von Willebrand factor type A, EGF and pentraxin domain-containing protein 1-like n=1 Tax=Sycon ciliatum TaxID=27933 RepID=UPI0031F71F50